MASVPSIGCLLAPNQYYRKASVSSGTSLSGSDSAHFVDDDTPQQGLPEVAESTWWFKSFLQSEEAEKASLLLGKF
ncbi:pancreatic progenitor cell differentiation and proliferation factor-like protein [Kogia breviceps]|uniref:pancreatic progenitor cell differentiation and proliferation factor-like protein n=1 Tax=Kogia breviceps TaxID=27615 RepID=UPI0034D2E967